MKTIQPWTICGPLFVSLAGLLLVACSQPDPRTTPILAATPAQYDAWKASAEKVVTPAEMEEFDACVNEIRMGIMQRREASGSDGVAQKLCEYINGKTMPQVLIMGYQSTVAWVNKEIDLKRETLAKNTELLKQPINDASRQKIIEHAKTVEENIKNTLEVKLEEAKKRLAELRAAANTKAAP